jgi:sec-independent protein translocase protein TatA
MVGFWQIVVILVILFLFFGPSRIEKLGPSLGRAIRGFKKGLNGAGLEEKDQEEDAASSSKSDDSGGHSKT